jgi:uncharacterized glyoxalase superfamily protein PhnB
MDFYKAAFEAVEECRWEDEGRISHAELAFGDSRMYLSDEFPDMGVLSPQTQGGFPLLLVLEVADADAAVTKAVLAGAVQTADLKDESYGRLGRVTDPFGHKWMLIAPATLG